MVKGKGTMAAKRPARRKREMPAETPAPLQASLNSRRLAAMSWPALPPSCVPVNASASRPARGTFAPLLFRAKTQADAVGELAEALLPMAAGEIAIRPEQALE